MSGRTEIEDCLEEHAWRERNQLDTMPQIGAAVVPPMEALKAQAVREYPMEYDTPRSARDLRVFFEFVAFLIFVLAATSAATWAWNNTWALALHR